MNAKRCSCVLVAFAFAGCASFKISHPPDQVTSTPSPGEVGVIGLAFSSSATVLENEASLIPRSEAFLQGIGMGGAAPVRAFVDSGVGRAEYLGGALFVASIAVTPLAAITGGISGLADGVSKREIAATESVRKSLNLCEDLGNSLAAKLTPGAPRKFRRVAGPVSEYEISRPHRVSHPEEGEVENSDPGSEPSSALPDQRVPPIFAKSFRAATDPRVSRPGRGRIECSPSGCVHATLTNEGIDAVLNFSTVRLCLRKDPNDEKANALLTLSILIRGRLTGANGGRELGTVYGKYESEPRRYSEWAASGAKLLRAEWATAMDALSSQVATWLAPSL
jgi:hypothetical protein